MLNSILDELKLHSPLEELLCCNSLMTEIAVYLCQEEVEIANNLICECVAVTRRRQVLPEKQFLPPEEVRKAAPKVSIRFLKETRII